MEKYTHIFNNYYRNYRFTTTFLASLLLFLLIFVTLLVKVPNTNLFLRAQTVSGVIRLIDVGSTTSYVDSQGRTWEPDAGYIDPAGNVVTRTVAVAGTRDQKIYQTERNALRGYSLPIADGSYTVKLHFNDASSTAVGQRVMGIKIENIVVPRLDVLAKAGSNTAYVETVSNVVVKDGKLDIRFTHFTDEVAMLDGIEVLQGTAPAATCVDTNTCQTVDVKALVENAVAAGKSYVRIPPGTHRISSLIYITNGNGIVIDGTDATIIMTTRGTVFSITGSGATLKGMTIDYDPLPFTQGTITSIDNVNRTVQISLHDGYPDGSWFTDSTYQRAAFSFDPTTRDWKGDWITFGSLSTTSNSRKIKLSKVNGINQIAIGQYMAIVKRTYDPAIQFYRGTGLVVLDQVKLRSTAGIAVYSQHWDGGSRLEWLTIERGPRPAGATQDRLISANMDALRFVLNRKGPEVHGADISWMGDDGNNWQGYPFHVTQKESNISFIVSPSPSWVDLAYIYRPGDTFRLMDGTNATVKAVAPIQSVVPVGGGFRVTLQTPISVASGSTDIVDVPEINSPNGILRDSYIHDHRADGMRNQANNTLIQGNLFENNLYSAVSIAGQYTDWFESGWSQGVRIIHNVMRNADRGIEISAFKGMSAGHKDITISDNFIENMKTYGIYLSTVDHPVVKNNSINSAPNSVYLGSYVINQDISNNNTGTVTSTP